MKFILISIVLHLIIFFSGFSLNLRDKSFEIKNSGTNLDIINISVDFTPTSEPPKVEEFQEEVAEEKIPEEKPELEEVTKTEEKVEEKKEVVEKPIEKKVEKKEIKKEKTEPKKKPQPKQPKKENKTPTQPKKPTLSNDNFIQLSNGVYAAKNQGVEGLKYSVISQPDPEYPLPAKRIGYNKEVIIKVRFLVGFDGKIEEIKFYGDDIGLGFRDEVTKALNKWEFSPITVKNEKIKLYFYKVFKFNQKK